MKPENQANLEEVTKSRHIQDATRFMLWGKSAGRCQFMGCNKPIWKNPVSQEPVNIAQAAHIYAYSDQGPRGNEGIDPSKLNDLENLMLTCHACHKTIDSNKDGGRYTVELLQSWKLNHESRVERVTGIDPGCHSFILHYGTDIGNVSSPFHFSKTAVALFDQRHPAEDRAIEIGTGKSEWTEKDPEFWRIAERELTSKYERLVAPRLAEGEIDHLSVFGLTRMPLLIKLGTLLTDIHDVDVFQLHRNPKGWSWPEKDDHQTIEPLVERPESYNGTPALVVSLSATITNDRVTNLLGEDTNIWKLTLAEPNKECIRSRADLAVIYQTYLKLLDEIKAKHGHDATLSIFPSAPVSTMIQLGLARQPKADMDWVIYDEVRELGGFIKALDIPNNLTK